MDKIIKGYFIFLLLTSLAGCNSLPAKIDTVEVKTLVIYVPKSPDVTPPTLAYNEATPEQRADAKEAVKLLTVDATQLFDYSKQLLAIIDKYNELAKNNPDIEKMLADKNVSNDDKTKLKALKDKFDNIFKKK